MVGFIVLLLGLIVGCGGGIHDYSVGVRGENWFGGGIVFNYAVEIVEGDGSIKTTSNNYRTPEDFNYYDVSIISIVVQKLEKHPGELKLTITDMKSKKKKTASTSASYGIASLTQ